MAIGNAVQRGHLVYVYDEKGQQTATLGAGCSPGDGLKGYTSGTVNVQQGHLIYSYNEKGQQVACTQAR